MSTKQQNFTAEIAIVGGGPAGLITALGVASTGAETLLVAPPPPGADRRTTALLDGSTQVLKSLGAWPLVAEEAAPLKFLRLIDATNRLLRAPEILFDSAELALDAFGHNVENETLRQVLVAICSRTPGLRVLDVPVTAVKPDENGVTLTLGDKQERVRLVAAADGRKSICRSAAGIQIKSRELPQSAIVLNLSHSSPHNDTSTEFHTESGPFTFAPLKGNRSSMVCVVRPDEAEAIGKLNDDALALEVERRAHSILGKMTVESDRGIFPLSTALADRFAARRVVLIGEAAHVLPPIGAQGLNLGIRDAAALMELVQEARDSARDPGGADLLRDYDERRRMDVRSRTLVVDLANRSLMSDFLPIHAARGIGLHLASRVGFFRRALMRQGLGHTTTDSR